MTSYELRLDIFKGPLEKLLELIEKRELDITGISLAAVTDDFIKYVRSLDDVPPALLADFISVASQLLLLKSRAILPSLPLTSEEEEGILDLEERLKIYQELRQAFKTINQNWRSSESLHGRSYLPSFSLQTDRDPETCYPGKNLNIELLEAAANGVVSFLIRTKEETETVKEKIVRLEDKMEEIISRIQDLGQTSFKNLSASSTKSELIVVFLAILHLAREQLVDLEQKGRFSDIMVASGQKKSPIEDNNQP